MDIHLKVTNDGDQVCVLWGENLQEGRIGFGDTLSEALRDLALSVEDITNDQII